MSVKMNHIQRRRGVTLIETLMTITLVGTLTAMGLPSMNSTTRQRRVIAASNALRGDIESAFSVAARQRRPIRLTYDASAGEVRVADRSSGVIYSRRPLKGTSEYRLDAVTMSPSSVDVFAAGAGSAAFTITLNSGSFSRRVTVTRAGVTRIVVP